VIYDFSGSVLIIPIGSPVFDSQGNLYGATFSGGISGTNCTFYDCGSIFKLSPPTTQGGVWNESTVYNFTGNADGAYPIGSLAIDGSGSLYGAASYGATIFKLTPGTGGNWNITVLYTFLPNNNSWRPNGALLINGGNVFGTTFYGGNFGCGLGCGTVYKLAPPARSGDPWTQTVLHVFGVTGDGHNPNAGLIARKDGLLYGTTDTGGIGSCSSSQTRGCGTVYSIIP